MKLRRLPILLLFLLAAACAAYDPSGQAKPTRGLGTAWTAFLLGLFGILFPDITTDWTYQDNRTVTRIMSAPILIFGSVLLFSYYFDLSILPR